jgi:hypothetical protein
LFIAVLSVSERGRFFPIVRSRILPSKMALFALFSHNCTLPHANNIVSLERDVISHYAISHPWRKNSDPLWREGFHCPGWDWFSHPLVEFNDLLSWNLHT